MPTQVRALRAGSFDGRLLGKVARLFATAKKFKSMVRAEVIDMAPANVAGRPTKLPLPLESLGVTPSLDPASLGFGFSAHCVDGAVVESVGAFEAVEADRQRIEQETEARRAEEAAKTDARRAALESDLLHQVVANQRRALLTLSSEEEDTPAHLFSYSFSYTNVGTASGTDSASWYDAEAQAAGTHYSYAYGDLSCLVHCDTCER